MRKILFLVLILSAVGVGSEKHESGDLKKEEPGSNRPEGDAKFSKEVKGILETLKDPNGLLLPGEIEKLEEEDKKKLLEEVEAQLENSGLTDEDKKPYEAVKKLLAPRSEKGSASGGSAQKPTSTHLQTTGGKVIGKDGKIDVYKLPNGFEVHLDPQGRKTVDGQPLVVVGKEGAAMMDGLFPASAFGLQVGDKGAISIDPKPSMLTVSGNNGPKINSAVPVIFNDKGDAFARQGMLDEKGNQTLYWANGIGDVFSSVGKNGGEIVTVSKEKLPAVLEARGTDSGKYLAVKAQPAEETPSGVFTVAQMVEELGRPSFPGINQSPPKRSSPDAPPKASLESIMQEFSKTRELFAPAPATPDVTPVEASSASPRDSLTQSAVSASPCANGKCNLQAVPPTRRKVCTARGCFYQ